MADQLSGGMGNLAIDSNPAAAQQAGPGGPRSYIPPHMRGKMANGPAPGPPPMNGPAMGGPLPSGAMGGPQMGGPQPGAMNGLNNSAWAG
jgi:ATP-dependent RNA helicase DDX3X